MNIWQTVKLVVISIVALLAITFLTVDPPKRVEKKTIVLDNLPKTVELIGFENQEFATKSIIKKETLLFIGNQKSIVLASELDKALELPVGKFVVVSNISDEPWFIKKWQAHTQNKKLKGEKKLPWIYDKDGNVRNFLQLQNRDISSYFIYKVNSNGVINKIYEGKISIDTLDRELNEEEINKEVLKIVKTIKN